MPLIVEVVCMISQPLSWLLTMNMSDYVAKAQQQLLVLIAIHFPAKAPCMYFATFNKSTLYNRVTYNKQCNV